MTKVDEVRVARKYSSLYDSAASRGLDFDLKFSTLKRLLNTKRCYYTGIKMDINTDPESPHRLTLDRLDNDKGYVEGNVVACCRRINKMKGCLNLKDIRAIYRGILKRNLL